MSETSQSASASPPCEPWWANCPDVKFTSNPMPIFSESERRQWLDERARRERP